MKSLRSSGCYPSLYPVDYFFYFIIVLTVGSWSAFQPIVSLSALIIIIIIVPETIFKGHRQYHPSLDRLYFLTETGKVDYTCLKKHLKWPWRWIDVTSDDTMQLVLWSICVSLLHRFCDIQRRIMARSWNLGYGSCKVMENGTIR